jgi:hypothetical protein
MESMHKSTIDLVKSLGRGTCTCYFSMGSSYSEVDLTTGKFINTYDKGPRQTCLRCQAREALEADKIEYEKVDVLPYVAYNASIDPVTQCTCMSSLVASGTISFMKP